MKGLKLKKKDIILISILGVLIIFALWFFLRSDEPDTQSPLVGSPTRQTIGSSTNGLINLPSRSIFLQNLNQDARFNDLNDYRESSAIPDYEPGRDNPFQPFTR